MATKKLETNHFIWELEDGILRLTYKPGILSLEIAKEVVKSRKEFTNNTSYPNLVMQTGLTKVEKEARDYLSSEEGSEGISAGAILTNSAFQMTLANFFLKVSRPRVPARMFTSKKQAIQWLSNYK